MKKRGMILAMIFLFISAYALASAEDPVESPGEDVIFGNQSTNHAIDQSINLRDNETVESVEFLENRSGEKSGSESSNKSNEANSTNSTTDQTVQPAQTLQNQTDPDKAGSLNNESIRDRSRSDPKIPENETNYASKAAIVRETNLVAETVYDHDYEIVTPPGIDSQTDFTQPFSIAFWFRTPNNTTGPQVLLARYSWDDERAWYVHTNSGNDLIIRIFHDRKNGGSNFTDIGFYDFITPNKENHIAITYDPNISNKITVHKNGIKIEKTLPYQIPATTGQVTVGKTENNYGTYTGEITDIRLYQRILSDAEIRNLENNTEIPPINQTNTTNTNDTANSTSNTSKNIAPVANFTMNTTRGQIPLDIRFTSTSYDINGTIISYSWDFGDQTTSSQQNPTHKYISQGNFTATLTVTDNDGNKSSTSRKIEALQASSDQNQTINSSNSWLEFNQVGGSTGLYIPSNVDFSKEFSISFWFKMPSNNAGDQIILSKYNWENKRSWYIHTNSGNDLFIRLFHDPKNGGGNFTEIGISDRIQPNTWHHASIIFNKTHMSVRLDGSSKIAKLNKPIQATAAKVVAGKAETGDTKLYKGSISDLRIYDSALSEWQISLLEAESRFGDGMGQRIPIIYYHDIDDDAADIYSMSVSEFSSEMKYLHDNGFTTITLRNYYDWIRGDYQMPKKPVLIMFDDATISAHNNAYPILMNYNFVGSLPVITYAPDEPYEYYMNWVQIQQWSDSGWEILSHSVDHAHFLSLSESGRTYQFEQSRQDIMDNLGIIPLGFVYPYNEHDSASDSLCSQFYAICTGNNNGIINPMYAYKISNLTGGLWRIGTTTGTTFEQFKNAADEMYRLRGWYKLDDGGAIAKDSGSDRLDGQMVGSGYAWRV